MLVCCGGGGGPAPTTATTIAASQRLTSDQWSTYRAWHDTFSSTNDASSVAALQRALDSSTVPGASTALDSILTASSVGLAAQRSFEAGCAPK